MLKSWIRRLIFALLFIPLASISFRDRSPGQPVGLARRDLAQIVKAIEVSQSNLPPGFQIVSIAREQPDIGYSSSLIQLRTGQK